MFERRGRRRLLQWMSEGDGIAVLTGPSRVGKTTMARDLGVRYQRCVEMDLGASSSRSLLRGCGDQSDLVSGLQSAFGRDSVVLGDTLVLLDGAQDLPDAPSVLRRISCGNDVDIVVTGSSPFSLGSGFPHGPDTWEVRIPIEPLDFREFLAAMGVDPGVVAEAEASVAQGTRPASDVHRTLDGMFRRYTVTGGMPQAVAAMASTGRLADVLEASSDILESQMACARRRCRRFHDVILDCVGSMPRQLEDNGRFTYAKVGGGHDRGNVAQSVGWLASEGILRMCPRASHPIRQASLAADRGIFKAYVDPGTLAHLMPGWAADAAMNGNYGSCPCAVAENAVANLLMSSGREVMYYSRDRREADFVVGTPDGVVGIAVRSGNNDRRKSLGWMEDSGMVSHSVELGGDGRSGRLPLYAAGFPEALLRIRRP